MFFNMKIVGAGWHNYYPRRPSPTWLHCKDYMRFDWVIMPRPTFFYLRLLVASSLIQELPPIGCILEKPRRCFVEVPHYSQESLAVGRFLGL